MKAFDRAGRTGSGALRPGRTWLWSFLLALSVVPGCEDGPDGPGTLDVSVEGPALGGAVVVLTGAGLAGVGDGPDSRAFADPAGNEGERRVVVVRTGTGPLRFTVDVRDVARLPQGRVESAVDGANQPVPVDENLTVRVNRRN